MFEIKENTRTLPEGTEIQTFSRQTSGWNTVEVEAGTNGYHGGNESHGSRIYLRIQSLAGSDMLVNRLGDPNGDEQGFEIIAGGDSELESIINSLKFALQVLEDQIKGDC